MKILNSNDERTKDYYSVNCAGALYCIKYFLNNGKSSGKKIINVLAEEHLLGIQRMLSIIHQKQGFIMLL